MVLRRNGEFVAQVGKIGSVERVGLTQSHQKQL